MTNRATPRDEVAFYTLIAHRAEDRERAYAAFVATWRAMEASDFPSRLRRCVGLEVVEPAPAADEPAPETPDAPEVALNP